MNKFWNTPEGKILAHGIHEHNSAMFILGACINRMEKKRTIRRFGFNKKGYGKSQRLCRLYLRKT